METAGGHRRTLESHVRGLMNELARQARPPPSGDKDYVHSVAPGTLSVMEHMPWIAPVAVLRRLGDPTTLAAEELDKDAGRWSRMCI